ncbi:MAG TPA: hypothetical protein VFQ25_11910 [Ktedonobacterales bacterium]|nr:hypothetical protein [Ktedonobacterales bacterium]
MPVLAPTHLNGKGGIAALLSGKYQSAPGERVGVIICGGNTDAVRFSH